ncbi:MAG TPA: pitrilysin family protein [Deltaproteobacteria bacterium]|jgi:predicted Zn-dependent peptidase|nr:pitrilysin family protein [Deltaproteobacteria bacterium]
MVKTTVLDNGVRIVSEKMSEVRSVSLGIWVSVGSTSDPPKCAGMAHIVEHMLFKGTHKRSAVQIAQGIDALGGVLNAQTAKEYTVYYTRVLDEYVEKAADVLFDLFLNSVIAPEELDKERKVVLQEIRMTEDTPDDYITDLFSENFFQDSPLGAPILGTIETVSSIERKDVFNFLSSFYSPSSIIISAVGNLEHDALVALVRPRFNGLTSAAVESKTATFPSIGGKVRSYNKDIEQVHITLGTIGSSMLDEARWPYIVLNTMLGGSMSSMLFQEVREKLGLAYSIYSYLSSYRECGVLAMYAATTPRYVKQTIDVIVKQLEMLKHGDFGGISLNDVKTQIKGNLLLSRESTSNRMSSLAKNEMYYGRDISIEEVIQKIQDVKAEALVALAEEIFQSSKITLVTLGKLQEDIESLPLS